MKRNNIFWGLFFILAAVLMILTRLDFFQDFHFFKLFGTVLLFIWFFYSIFKKEFFGMLFSIAFLCILHDEFLGIEALTPFPVLAAALFGSIGLTIIFKKEPENNCFNSSTENGPFVERPNSGYTSSEEINNDIFSSNTCFSSNIKYVKSDHLVQASIRCNFGDSKIYFDDAMVQGNDTVIILDVHFGSATLYIPKTWTIINQASSVFGSIEEKNHSCSSGTPVITLKGNVAFGSVDIIYC